MMHTTKIKPASHTPSESIESDERAHDGDQQPDQSQPQQPAMKIKTKIKAGPIHRI